MQLLICKYRAALTTPTVPTTAATQKGSVDAYDNPFIAAEDQLC